MYGYEFGSWIPWMPAGMPYEYELMRNDEDDEDDDYEDKQILSMYPEIYFVISPVVKKHCDDMEKKHGVEFIPDRDKMEEMVKEIFEEIEEEMEKISENEEEHMRQYGYGRRRLPRDLTRIIFLDEMRGRRRRRRRPRPYPPYPQYPGYYPYPGFFFYSPYPGYHDGYYR